MNKHIFYSTIQEGRKVYHTVLLEEVLSTHLYETDLGHAMNIVFKEKVKQEKPLYSNTGKIKGNKIEQVNANVWITDPEEIKAIYNIIGWPPISDLIPYKIETEVVETPEI